jgi:hypothetical protein
VFETSSRAPNMVARAHVANLCSDLGRPRYC